MVIDIWNNSRSIGSYVTRTSCNTPNEEYILYHYILQPHAIVDLSKISHCPHSFSDDKNNIVHHSVRLIRNDYQELIQYAFGGCHTSITKIESSHFIVE